MLRTLPSPLSTIGRADLLRVLAADGEQGLEKMAFALGYEKVCRQEAIETFDATGSILPVSTATAIAPATATVNPTPAARFFCVTERIPIPPKEGHNPLEPPAWLKQAKILTRDERPDPATVRLPTRLPLTCWARLWPFLRRALGQTGLSRQLDIPRVIRTVTQGEVLRRLPWRTRHRWSAKLCILLDYNRRTQPFRQDFNALCAALEALHGTVGLDIRILHGEPGRQTRYRQPGDDTLRRWQMPDAHTRLLILSDLGLLDASAETVLAWRQFGCQLRAAACKPVVLSPVAAQSQEAGLHTLFSINAWDRNSRFPLGGSRPAPLDRAADGAEQLLALAAPAIVIESALLRSLRYLVPVNQASAADEARVWSHPDIAASSQGCCFANPAAIAKYQQLFQALDPPLQHRAVAAIRAHHAGLPDSVRYAELDVCERLAPGVLEASVREEVRQWKRAVVKTADQSNMPLLREWQNRHLHRHPYTASLWQDNPELAALWAIAQRGKQDVDATAELPPQVSAEQVWYFLQQGTGQTRAGTLCQRGQDLILDVGEAAGTGSFFARMDLSGGMFVRQSRHSGMDCRNPEHRDVDGGLLSRSGVTRSQAPAWEREYADLSLSENSGVPKLELGNQREMELGNQREIDLGNQREIELGDQQSQTDSVLETESVFGAHYIPVHPTGTRLAGLTLDTLSLELETATEILRIESLVKPRWATGMGRDRDGLFAEVEWLGEVHRLYWQPPKPLSPSERGAVDNAVESSPLPSPPAPLPQAGEGGKSPSPPATLPQAGGGGKSPSPPRGEGLGRGGDPIQRGTWQGNGPVGFDEFGLYADLHVKQATQRFRWIEPGTFLMGSPATEPERLEDRETQHEVTLTLGYWLADSACTQALWLAVTGDNPSRFKDDANNPVEQISWNDVDKFIHQINQSVIGLDARLPTEAEWEYACRAGTTTPFSLGENITPEQVNYDGNYPYAGGAKGLYRKKTVPVKSLPPNPWGLHEMHGNVLEWCQDWFAEFDAMPQTDPPGPTTGAFRVLRGGSWSHGGRYVRSALRRRIEPGYRDGSFGFRLALGQTGPGQSAARLEPGQPLAERRGGQGESGAAGILKIDEPTKQSLLNRLKNLIKPP
ncbi:MAG: formylglycine-generating enzyme family protein [Proteobacteria bacterium]|nr:formylglycine-generating enzyme family protein [Pseudomonadota bacterium]